MLDQDQFITAFHSQIFNCYYPSHYNIKHCFSLVQLASMAENLDRGGGAGPVQHNFTLADLISNVAEVS
jgi:hypothetical protein